MREEIKVTGMVISSIPIGEYDKRLVILTKELGKIHAFARGARRQNSTLLATSQPFTFGTFGLYAGKSAYNLAGAQVENYFLNLRQDLDRVYYGFYFLELADYFARENLDGTELLKLLYQSFRALMSHREGLDADLILYRFEWKILGGEGIMPLCSACAACGCSLKEETGAFSIQAGGVVCPDCASRYSDRRSLSPTALYALRYIAAVPVEKLYTFTLTEAAKQEIGRLAKQYYQRNIDGVFHSLDLL